MRTLLTMTIALTVSAQALAHNANMRIEGETRIITADGLPDHATGEFPNANNPNRISEQSYEFRVPFNPKLSGKTTLVRLGRIGVALNGIPFDPGAAEFFNRSMRSGWQIEPLGGAINLGLDENLAHVQPNGAYHYHGIPKGLLDKLGSLKVPVLVGYAADGFPIYVRPNARSSYRLRKGTREGGPGGEFDGKYYEDYVYVRGGGDLDDCNGATGDLAPGGKFAYHYELTTTFPFVPRCLKGTPDRSVAPPHVFMNDSGLPPGDGSGGGPPPGGPFGRRPPPPGHRPPPPIGF